MGATLALANLLWFGQKRAGVVLLRGARRANAQVTGPSRCIALTFSPGQEAPDPSRKRIFVTTGTYNPTDTVHKGAAGNLRPQLLPLSRTRPPAERNCPTEINLPNKTVETIYL